VSSLKIVMVCFWSDVMRAIRSELRTGILEELGYFPLRASEYTHNFELFMPKNIGERRICGFVSSPVRPWCDRSD
jgi:hypothetical protein